MMHEERLEPRLDAPPTRDRKDCVDTVTAWVSKLIGKQAAGSEFPSPVHMDATNALFPENSDVGVDSSASIFMHALPGGWRTVGDASP
jgi:hypothetical protein